MTLARVIIYISLSFGTIGLLGLILCYNAPKRSRRRDIGIYLINLSLTVLVLMSGISFLKLLGL